MTNDIGILISEARASARVEALAAQIERHTRYLQRVTAREAALTVGAETASTEAKEKIRDRDAETAERVDAEAELQGLTGLYEAAVAELNLRRQQLAG